MLAILATHPIQYQAPLWRALGASAVPFRVFYMSRHGLDSQPDRGFGRAFAWDIDLLQGYPHEFLDVRESGPQGSFGWLRLERGFADLLRSHGVRVLWVQGWQVMAYWQAIRQARKAGIEVWLRGDSNLRSNAGRLPRRLKWWALRRLLDRVDRFLTVGVANRAFYSLLGYGQERMSVAPHCVENARFAEQAASLRESRTLLRQAWGIRDDAFCLLFAGKFVSRKRPLDLVAAVHKLQASTSRPLHILWVGAGELDAALREASMVQYDAGGGGPTGSGAPGGPAGSFVGFLNQSEIARAYVAADALVLPSDAKETWGLVVNEAMATGLPCVVSDACGCAEDLVLPLRPDLCFPVGDIDGLARALAAVIDHPPSPQLLQDHIRRYDPACTVESVAALYPGRQASA